MRAHPLAPAPHPASAPSRLAPRLAAIVALALAIHGRSVAFGFSYLDDDVLIVDNQNFLARPASLWRAFGRPYLPSADRDHFYYRPVVNASYVLDSLWSGGDPRGYHLTNVLLHALAGCLLFLWLRRLAVRVEVAWLGALLFVAHPALAETVAWIPGRNDSLLTVFALMSWLWLPRAGDEAPPARGPSPRATGGSIGRKVGHLCALLGALLTKEAAIVLPALYLIDLLGRERRPWRQVLRPWLLGGWVGVLAIYLGARAAVAGVAGRGVGAAGASGVSVGRVLHNLPALVVGGLGKLIIPIHLAVLAIPRDTWLWPGVLAAGLVVIAAVFVPAVRRRTVLFGMIIFVAGLAPGAPASNMLILENRLYLPAIGIILIACEAAGRAAWPARIQRAAAAALVTLFAAASVSYAGDFRERLTFAEAAVRGAPHSSLAHRNLGVTYQLTGDSASARREYERALAEDAAEPIAHNNLGVLLMARGQLPDAERELREELRINPHYARAHHNLALVLHALGRDAEATPHWEASLARDPDDAEATRALADHRGPGGRP